MASGVEVARAWLRLLHGTWEPVAPTGRSDQWCCSGLRSVAHGRSPSSGNCEGLSTGAGHRGGPSRSSAEGPVMGGDRRGAVIRGSLAVNRLTGPDDPALSLQPHYGTFSEGDGSSG